MKKIHLILIALAFFAAPFSAEAGCIMYSCQYVVDGEFGAGGTYWTESGTTYPSVTDYCLATPQSNTVARIGNGGYIEQTFYVNDSHLSWSFQLHPRLVNDTDNWYDQLKIIVTNQTTSQTEVFYMRGSSHTNSCNSVSFSLSKDYDYSNVKVRIEVASLSLSAWDIDNVGFWGHDF